MELRSALEKVQTGALGLRSSATEGAPTGHLDEIRGLRARGWNSPGGHPGPVDIWIEGELVGTYEATDFRVDLRDNGIGGGRCAFDVALPLLDHYAPGATVEVEAFDHETKRPLVGSPISFRVPEPAGHLDIAERDRVAGWLEFGAGIDAPVELELRRTDGLPTIRIVADLERGDIVRNRVPARCGFDVGFAPLAPGAALDIRIAGTRRRPFGGPFRSEGLEDLLERGFQLSAALRREADSQTFELLDGFFPDLMDALRRHHASTPLSSRLIPIRERPSEAADLSDAVAPSGVHVIIPVFDGIDETLACIASVLRAENETPWKLTVVWDCGPSETLLNELRTLTQAGEFELIENTRNLGFVGSVNLGLARHATLDAIILNADTEVACGWIDRLRTAAYSDPGIGTVTPMSNNATIFSYPHFCADNPYPDDLEVAEVDADFAVANAGIYLDAPTGHGFCLFTRRAMLREVGVLDESTFGRGYGEENDLCIRAAQLGWRSVVACDVFVRHHGSISFQDSRQELLEKNLGELSRRYPEYNARVASTVHRDPYRKARNRVAIRRLKRARVKHPHAVLMVSHHLGGGTERAISDLCAPLEKQGVFVGLLSSTADGVMELSAVGDYRWDVVSVPEEDTAGVVEMVGGLEFSVVHYHHVGTAPHELVTLAERLAIPYVVTLHDYFVACPRINFVRANGDFCTIPKERACEACVVADGIHPAINKSHLLATRSVAGWRSTFTDWLTDAAHVFAPSQDAAATIERLLPGVTVKARAHPELTSASSPVSGSDGPLRVGLLGALGPHKGSARLLELASYASNHELPLEFVVVGYTDRDAAFERLPNVTITGAYETEELVDIVARERLSVALFLSIWPETYSYTLSEALALGLHVVALDLGAIGERLRALNVGTLVDPDVGPRRVAEALLASPDRRLDEGTHVGGSTDGIVSDFYEGLLG